MNQLDLLQLLQNHYNLLSKCNDEKKHLSESNSNDQNHMTLIQLEKDIDTIRAKNKNIKEKLNKTEKSLKEYSFTIKEIEDMLYSGDTSDIKQLQVLSEEKDNIKKIISNTETKLLEYMEEIEINEGKLITMDDQLKKIVKDNQNNKKEYIKKDRELNINIDNIKLNIEKAKLDIEDELLVKYQKIRKNKKLAIVEMVNGVCLGCNMTISKHMVEKIKINDNIMSCENCGRILCKQKLSKD